MVKRSGLCAWLALPGDVIGVEQWVGTEDAMSLRALTGGSIWRRCRLTALMMTLLMETVVVSRTSVAV